MTDFNGLGILLEEKEHPLHETIENIRQEEFEKEIHQDHENENISSEAGSELLLPPLPDEEDINPIVPSIFSTNTYTNNTTMENKSLSGFNSPFSNTDKNLESSYFTEDSRRGSDYSEILSNSCLSSYELSSPGLNMDSNTFQNFPSTSANTPAKDASQPSTSPLKRLKSLKNGIRKLSLSSKSAPVSNLPTPTLPIRPVLSPIQTFSKRSSQDSSDSILTDNNFMNSSDRQSFPSLTMSKRARALSSSALTPLTPSYSSPVITLSENLQNSKRSLLNIEHSYFDSLQTSKNNQNNNLSNNIEGEYYKSNDRNRSITELSKPSELLDYLMFLKDQKKSVTDAFELTRQRLKDSGWCSEHDLNNLQLQQDSSLCQLETKLLQIKERLDSEFNMSLFNESSQMCTNSRRFSERTINSDIEKQALSPSLKTLENRCFSFSEIR
ncbi:hypothetical protein CAAN1_01S10924 [[Candida] anglica]|uniref:Uncharacterized protein n=1 Tax=[Candida] anglica TaxID=148631 RepID=A0ABP0EN35_9ASCO